jgi:hypothetical protein
MNVIINNSKPVEIDSGPSIGFGILYELPSRSFIAFGASLDGWLTSYHAQLVALIIAATSVPYKFKLNIQVACKSLYRDFTAFSSTLGLAAPQRRIYKIPLYYHWSLLFTLIRQKELSISVLHTEEVLTHPLGSQLAACIQTATSKPIIELSNSVNSFLPIEMRWKNLPLTIPLRAFLKDYTNVCSFESWLNLHRNFKYRSLHVDWSATFSILNDDIISTQTSAKASALKTFKVKLMTEEIPTLEHMKLIRPALYKDWNCLMCGDFRETFMHVWTCPQHYGALTNIIQKHKSGLMKMIRDICRTHNLSYHCPPSFDDEFLWLPLYDAQHFTFIDVIKGIVPVSLYKDVSELIKDTKISLQLLSNFYHAIFLDVHRLVWLPRCETVVRFEQHLGISQKQKQRRRSNIDRAATQDRYRPWLNIGHASADLYTDQSGCLCQLRSGKRWLDFTPSDSYEVFFGTKLFVVFLKLRKGHFGFLSNPE